MAKQLLGRVAMDFKGEFNSSSTYEKLDVVVYEGCSYCTLKETKGNLPTNEEFFVLLVRKPISGIDYFTEDEKEEFVSRITDDANSLFNQNVDSKTKEFNTNHQDKVNDFNDNYDTKLSSFNSNYDSKVKKFNNNVNNQTTTFNENVVEKQKEFDDNVTNQTETFNTNTTNKINEYNTNASNKLNDYNSNDTVKLKAYNDNASIKVEEYNTNANNKVEEFNANAVEKTNEFNSTTNAQKITSLSNEFYRVKDEVLETGEASDTFIHLEDSSMSELQELSVDGVCEQETTTGKNSLDLSNLTSRVWNGLTITRKKDGSYSFSGTATTSTSLTIPLNLTLSPGTYTFSFETVQGYLARLDDENNVGIFTIRDNSKSSTVTLSEEKQIKRLYFWASSGNTYNKNIFPQLEQGSTATEYEPFTGSQPSPNPEYSQEIKTITGDLNLSSCRKNLFKPFTAKKVVSGITATASNGEIRLSGTSTQEVNQPLWGLFSLDSPTLFKLKKGTYTFSGMGEYNGDVRINVVVNGKGIGIYGSKSITFNEDVDVTGVFMFVKDGQTIDITFKPQCEYASQETSFEEYIASQITANLPEGEFLGKLDDTYKDTLNVKYNQDDGQYHLILNKNIGKVVLNGSENWTLATNGFILGAGEVYKYFKRNLNVFNGICNYFLVNTTSVAWGKNNHCGWNTVGVFWIREDHKLAITVEDFKTLLSTHNTEVYYVLATPYEIDLGPVEMPLSYNEITNIFTDNDLLPRINAKYYRNFKKTVQNLQVNNDTLKNELMNIEDRLTALKNVNTSTVDVEESEVTE